MTALPKPKPITFTSESVGAILAGPKTQTRRLANLATLRVWLPRSVRGDVPGSGTVARPGLHLVKLNQHGAVSVREPNLGLRPGEFTFRSPWAEGETRLVVNGPRRAPGVWLITPKPGCSLWVRETWMPAIDAGGGPFRYAADYDAEGRAGMAELQRWRSPRVMPKNASRLALTVLWVRLERLQAISEEDARAEGVEPAGVFWHGRRTKVGGRTLHDTARGAYASLWDWLNGHRPGARWEDNPWVWAIGFQRLAATTAGARVA